MEPDLGAQQRPDCSRRRQWATGKRVMRNISDDDRVISSETLAPAVPTFLGNGPSGASSQGHIHTERRSRQCGAKTEGKLRAYSVL